MKKTSLALALAMVPAGAMGQDVVGTIEYGILQPDMTTPHTIPLAQGEQVIGIYAAPSIVQVPAQESGIVYGTLPYTPPAQDIDRVTGLPRNTAGWTGESTEPAGIGCFPQGVCAHLN